ncbi:MAG: RagB/SusD family nutrient uptake outer membrane protein [Paludibacter sp.]|nr:RagB/SusD family nutrient uptake outer membrane protein [Paludibacter sp.]
MNKITLYISALLLLGLTSCNDWLDLKPESETILEDYWQSESQATDVLAGCYRGLIKDGCVERMMVWGELRSDNVAEGNSMNEDMKRILSINITPTNGYADWGSFYSVINDCNTFLHYAPLVVTKDPNFTESKLHTLEAEALTIRALCYFYLVRTFRDVPLITTPSISDETNFNVPKSAERDILDQIIKDLIIAKQYAKPSFATEAFTKGRVTRNAVDAILADVYLWDQQYANCAAECDLILADKSLELVKGNNVVKEVFYAGNSTESIFELQFDRNTQYNNSVKNLYGFYYSNDGTWSYPAFLIPTGSYTPFRYQPATLNESATDIREITSVDYTPNGKGYNIVKYGLMDYTLINNIQMVIPRNPSITPNWILYRLSDVMLMKAEALVQLNRDETDLKSALSLVNQTYLRSNLTADSLKFNKYPDKGSMQDLVMRERHRELMFEGKRWFDLMRIVKRTKDATSILKYIGPKLTGDNLQIKKMSIIDALYMPIQQSQIDINHNLEQNPFYKDIELSSSN